MNSVLEIETALRQLPWRDRWEIARRLLDDLQEASFNLHEPKSPGPDAGLVPPLPDYAARRRQIFGDRVLPNMILTARAEERC